MLIITFPLYWSIENNNTKQYDEIIDDVYEDDDWSDDSDWSDDGDDDDDEAPATVCPCRVCITQKYTLGKLLDRWTFNKVKGTIIIPA